MDYAKEISKEKSENVKENLKTMFEHMLEHSAPQIGGDKIASVLDGQQGARVASVVHKPLEETFPEERISPKAKKKLEEIEEGLKPFYLRKKA